MVPVAVLFAVGAMSVLAFATCVEDKRRARRGGRRRIRERTLLMLGLAGGSPGLVLGMALSRHKVRKPAFLWRLLIVVAVQAVVAWILVRSA